MDMKKTGIYLMIIAVIIILVEHLLFRNLNYANAVDSHSRTIYINGFRSFAWPDYVGFVVFMTGLITLVAPKRKVGHRFN